MAYVINRDLCRGCSACAELCPAEAIRQGEMGKFVINADKCIDCGMCESVCPAGAAQYGE